MELLPKQKKTVKKAGNTAHSANRAAPTHGATVTGSLGLITSQKRNSVFMKLTPSAHLTEGQVNSGLTLVVWDGLAAEVMASLTGGAFLTALALKLGASNFQIGLLAAIPTLANLFQLSAIYLVQQYENRRAITVFTSLFARMSLFLVCFLPFLFPPRISILILIALLSCHYVLGSIAGLSWNSWMKDLIPEKVLGSFFSNRSRLIQMVSITLSFTVASVLDYVRTNRPDDEILTYSSMFFVGGIFGLVGIYLLARTPEPKVEISKQNMLQLLKTPFRNVNFRNLMIFQAFWAFSINLAAPFFTVYLLKMLQFPLTSIVAFTLLSQISNMLFIRIWGRYSDKYSNKSILQVCAPIYLGCILAWTFTTLPDRHFLTVPLLVVIHICSGISVSGINLALSNIGLKLAPKGNAIVYLSARSLLIAAVAGTAPLLGGLFADFFAVRELSLAIDWKGPGGETIIETLNLRSWDFFFALAFLLGLLSLSRLSYVKEEGEVEEKVIRHEIMEEMARNFRTYSSVTGLRSLAYLPIAFLGILRGKVRPASGDKKAEV